MSYLYFSDLTKHLVVCVYFRSGETASCTVVFILVYYFLMAALTWFVILTYAWHLTFRVLGTPRDLIQGKRGHFHLVAWSGPLVLTIVCLALTQVHTPSIQSYCGVMRYPWEVPEYKECTCVSWKFSINH